MVFDEKKFTSQIVSGIKKYKTKIDVYDIGQVESCGDGIAKISGLSEVMYNEILEFPNSLFGVAFNLEEQDIGVVILGDYSQLKEGDWVKTTDKILEVPVGEELLGRTINPLAQPLDDKPLETPSKAMPLEKIAPGVIYRQPVDTPLQTGIKAIDSMIPIGRGQRELIYGDRGTGKTTLAIDTIINQKGKDVICIYVAIGQKVARVARIREQLEKFDALDHTIIVAANASDPVSFQYIAPYSGCAIGEYFMEKGKDVLIVYDDLTKHAWAYRQISLLLRRPSGREAYPGDIFYLHSRLLERACRMADKYGGGSLTALPIIETQAGDVSSYIPTNVISITDGQIYLESDLFFAGIRPAVNAGLSVSRVGGAAQIKAMKKVASMLRLDYAQYRELAAFAQFTTDLDPTTKEKIERGSRIVEILKQPQSQPMPIAKQVIILWATTNGYLDDIPVSLVKKFEEDFLSFLEENQPIILSNITDKKELSKKTEKQLVDVVSDFKQEFFKEHNIENKQEEETDSKLKESNNQKTAVEGKNG